MASVTLGQNILSLRAQSKLAQSSSEVSKSSERLSSGLRINHASDDAAGLAVAMGLKSSSRVFTQALRNVNDGISYLNVGEGALDALTAITTRQLELAEQAANGTYSVTQRRALHSEADALTKEFNRIVAATTFNGRAIFDLSQTSNAELRIQAGYGTASGLSLSVGEGLGRDVCTGDFTLSQTITSNAGAGDAHTSSIVLGDVNGDGALDMIAAGDAGGQGQTMIFINRDDGSGTFNAGVTLVTNQGGTVAQTNSIVLADLNGDGALDLIAGGGSDGQGQAKIFLNNGQGSFSLGSTITSNYGSTNAWTESIAVGDVNGDGFVDLIAGGGVNNSVLGQTRIFLNDGRGNFTLKSSITSNQGNSSGYTQTVAMADMNGDGILDLIAGGFSNDTGNSQGQTKIFLNDGRGNFSLWSTFTSNTGLNNGGTSSLAAVDLNEDGYLDLITAGTVNSGGPEGQANLFLSDGHGSFTLYNTITSNSGGMSGTRSITMGDVNGDGYVDLVAAGYSSGLYGQTQVFLNDTRGNFSPSATLRSNSGGTMFNVTRSVAVGDINGDGANDLIAGGYTYTASYAGQAKTFFGTATKTATALHVNLLSQASARQALGDLQTQLTRLSNERGAIGAFQSRLETDLGKLSSERDNYLAAASRITDVDVGAESSALLRQQILQQTGASILAQANQQPALALQLLRS